MEYLISDTYIKYKWSILFFYIVSFIRNTFIPSDRELLDPVAEERTRLRHCLEMVALLMPLSMEETSGSHMGPNMDCMVSGQEFYSEIE